MNASVVAAIARAVRYLARSQASSGCWTDYRLPVGASDAWVTAYAGWSLSRCAGRTGSKEAAAAADAAARWLQSVRPYPAGWGYNGTTGADADSTGLAIALLDERGCEVRDEDRRLLASMWVGDGGGFVTYPGRSDAWSRPRVDVIFPAYAALPSECRAAWTGAAVAHVLGARATDGLWWGFWWAGPWYPTWTALALLESIGEPAPEFDPNADWPVPRTSLELAFLAGVLHRIGVAPLRDHVVDRLIERQQPDGQWEGGLDLRVADPGCDAPWERNDSGVLYRDPAATITTASALRMLAEVGS